MNDPISPPDRESLGALENKLEKMLARVRELAAGPSLTTDGLVELTAIYNNVAYVFLYLEANEEHVSYDHLLVWRDAFHDDAELDRRILGLLAELRCPDPEAEMSRVAYVEQLRTKLEAPADAGQAEAAALLAEAKALLAETSQDERELLERLGIDIGSAAPASVFYRLVSATQSAVTRDKLGRAWTARRDSRVDALVGVVDRMVDARRARHAAAGSTVLASTLGKCAVGEAEVEEFLDRYLTQALAGYEVLRAEVHDAVGGDPVHHFPYYMHALTADVTLPMFDVTECLDYIFRVASGVFDLSFDVVPTGNPHVVTANVTSGAKEIGQVNFDLWDTNAKSGANHTLGIRNRTDWEGLVQSPVAYVSCRFQHNADGVPELTFQNVHSLFHEFGHAVNHLLIPKRISNQSGLEYLPLERLEYLSMWFEKWVYHREFSSSRAVRPEDREGVAVSQRVKAVEYQRTYVERAVAAALDFELHRQSTGGLADAFRGLDERFGISRFCTLGDFPAYFTWPMFQANPGANFAYLFGAADSCQRFAAFEDLSLDEVAGRPELRELFATCLDFDLRTEVPDSAEVFALYDRLATRAVTPSGSV